MCVYHLHSLSALLWTRWVVFKALRLRLVSWNITLYRQCIRLNLICATTWTFLLLTLSSCVLSDVVSGSASQSSSANDISSMSTEHTLASDTDSSSIDTLTGPLDESQWNVNQTSPSFLLFTRSSTHFQIFLVFCVVLLSSQPQWIGLFFYFLFMCDLVDLVDPLQLVSDCCLEVKAMLSVGSMVYHSLLCGCCLTWSSIHDVCINIDFSGHQE